jgi:hypothetical protein
LNGLNYNPIYLIIDLPWESKAVKPRVEIYNLRNRECQSQYFEYTNKSNMLTHSLINRDIKVGGKMWLKSMNFIIQSNFRKIRLTGKSKIDKNIEELFSEMTDSACKNDGFCIEKSYGSYKTPVHIDEFLFCQTIIAQNTIERVKNNMNRSIKLSHKIGPYFLSMPRWRP